MARIDFSHTEIPFIGTGKMVVQLASDGISAGRKLVRSLKTEEIYLNEYESPRARRQAIRAYIQQYNTVRPHQALDKRTPETVYHNYFAAPCAEVSCLERAG